MFVSKSMTRKLITVTPETDILKVGNIMKENKIRHIPVVDETGILLGMVTDRDVRSAMPSLSNEDFDSKEEREKLSHLKVREIMATDLVTVSPLHTLQDVLLLFEQHHFGAFPVVDDKGFITGIISVRDLLRAFINVMGIGEPGALLCIVAERKIGQIKKIVDIITEENVSMGSILVARHWEEGKRAVFPYLMTNRLTRVKKKLQEAGYELLDPMKWHLAQLPRNE
ncbi:MAG: CBS and ACT domain-containing protein [Desulfobacterales bacterium]